MEAQNNNIGKKDVHLTSLFTPEQIVCHTDKQVRDTIILDMLKILSFECGVGSVKDAFNAVLERENDEPTVIGPHLAIPHARIDGIEKPIIGIVTSKQGFAYSESVNNPVHLMILILAPKAMPGIYLQTLRAFAKIFKDPSQTDKVVALDSAEKVWHFFDTFKLTLPEFAMVHDIMEPVTIKLHENDTLENAIDLFIKHNRLDIPVVDKENVLIGVVTSYELFKVCLPDYILWMDDLTPIINFEPFKDVLRNEGTAWLTEIMIYDYATVTQFEPAISAIKEISRKNAFHAYVLKDRKLVGIVSTNNFLRKILRE